MEVQFSPLAVLEGFTLNLDRLNVTVSTVPVDVDIGVTESKELITTLVIAKPASEMVLKYQFHNTSLIDKLLSSPFQHKTSPSIL